MVDVSVIIPTYNSGKYIEKAVNSAKIQKYVKEVIVVDDASTDDTREVLNNYIENNKITYIRNKINLGVAESRNVGVRKAKGKYIAFLDSDDWWAEDKLERQMQFMISNGYSLCGTSRKLVNELGEDLSRIIHVEKVIGYNELLHHNSLVCSSVVVLRELAIQVPMEYEELHEDYLAWLRMVKRCKYAYGLDEPLVYYRMTYNGKSRNKLKSAKMTFTVYRKLGYSRIQSCIYLVSHLANGIKKYSNTRKINEN